MPRKAYASLASDDLFGESRLHSHSDGSRSRASSTASQSDGGASCPGSPVLGPTPAPVSVKPASSSPLLVAATGLGFAVAAALARWSLH